MADLSASVADALHAGNLLSTLSVTDSCNKVVNTFTAVAYAAALARLVAAPEGPSACADIAGTLDAPLPLPPAAAPGGGNATAACVMPKHHPPRVIS